MCRFILRSVYIAIWNSFWVFTKQYQISNFDDQKEVPRLTIFSKHLQTQSIEQSQFDRHRYIYQTVAHIWLPEFLYDPRRSTVNLMMLFLSPSTLSHPEHNLFSQRTLKQVIPPWTQCLKQFSKPLSAKWRQRSQPSRLYFWPQVKKKSTGSRSGTIVFAVPLISNIEALLISRSPHIYSIDALFRRQDAI